MAHIVTLVGILAPIILNPCFNFLRFTVLKLVFRRVYRSHKNFKKIGGKGKFASRIDPNTTRIIYRDRDSDTSSTELNAIAIAAQF